MARLVETGSIAYDAMNHGLVNELTLQQVQSQHNAFVNSLSNSASQEFRENANTAFDRYAGYKVRSHIEAMMRKNERFWESNTHRHLRNIGDLQNAPSVMQHYIAAQPELGAKIQNQQAHGWGNHSLLDDGIGDDNHFYRILYHGMVQEIDGTEKWVQYFDEPEYDEHISLLERLDHLRTHDTVADLLGQGKDITDPLNGNW